MKTLFARRGVLGAVLLLLGVFTVGCGAPKANTTDSGPEVDDEVVAQQEESDVLTPPGKPGEEGGQSAGRSEAAVEPLAGDPSRITSESPGITGATDVTPRMKSPSPIVMPKEFAIKRHARPPVTDVRPRVLPSADPSSPSTARSADLKSTDWEPEEAAPGESEPEALAAKEVPEDATAVNRDAVASGASTDAQGPYDLVKVFYATDRKPVGLDSGDGSTLVRDLVPAAVAASVMLLFLLLGYVGIKRRLTYSVAVVAFVSLLSLAGYWSYNQLQNLRSTADLSVRYGNQRGEMQYGTCQVSIPWGHEIGELEAPSILRLEVREDARKHVVLQAIDSRPKNEFYAQLCERVEAASRREVFVFVHGYNVTFEGAARRTAQIAYDVGFAGAPIFFSWPSQGGLLKYTVDENNAEWAVSHLKQFLLEIVAESGAESVNLIAHSMGNRALTSALREIAVELRDDATIFNQIILAAPDVDAEIFRRDLAPALVRSANRVTLYASSNDQALVASKKVHGHARAGDSGAGLVVLRGIETIDVSTLNTSMLGHSYYGNSNPILTDIQHMIRDALPAAEREWLLPRAHGPLTYWVFESMRATANRPGQ